jgi:hypothetical protein
MEPHRAHQTNSVVHVSPRWGDQGEGRAAPVLRQDAAGEGGRPPEGRREGEGDRTRETARIDPWWRFGIVSVLRSSLKTLQYATGFIDVYQGQ